MYFVIILLLMTFQARDGKIRHSPALNENVGDTDNVDDGLVANKKGDHKLQTINITRLAVDSLAL